MLTVESYAVAVAMCVVTMLCWGSWAPSRKATFIWKEFNGAPPGTGRLLAAMFLLYVIGLGVLLASKV